MKNVRILLIIPVDTETVKDYSGEEIERGIKNDLETLGWSLTTELLPDNAKLILY